MCIRDRASVDRYAQQSTAAQAARKNGGTGSDTAADTADLAQRADDLQAITDSLLASTDKLLAGLTDVAGSTSAAEADLNKGAEGSLPEQTVTVDQIKTSATPAPTEPPADSAVSGETTPEPTAAPTEAPQPDNSGTGETINVTMNGTAQTMDLVQCLAMVAQNELGPNAPAEAYKAQCCLLYTSSPRIRWASITSTLPAPTRSARHGSASRWRRPGCGMTSFWRPNAAR